MVEGLILIPTTRMILAMKISETITCIAGELAEAE